MRVLVVEDEHKIASSIKKGLEQDGFAADLAFDGQEGYDLASTEEYSVIILDIMLPKLDGLAVCKKLRADGNHTPILILTARGEIDDRVEGLNLGADDYLVKPFAFSELIARIKALSRRPKVSLGTVLKAGSVVLDTLNYSVKKDDRLVELSKKEFSLLEYLMRHRGRVVSKENIIQSVWDYDANILPNTVEVFIGYLRNKLGSDFIKTVRGFGYKIE